MLERSIFDFAIVRCPAAKSLPSGASPSSGEASDEWGWTVPILIDKSGGVIAGHARLLAAQKLGRQPIATCRRSAS